MVKPSYNLSTLLDMVFKCYPQAQLMNLHYADALLTLDQRHFLIELSASRGRPHAIEIGFRYSGFYFTWCKSPLPLSEKGTYIYLNELFAILKADIKGEFEAKAGKIVQDLEFRLMMAPTHFTINKK